MRDDAQDLGPEVIAADEADHAVAAIVYGASFRGIQINRKGSAVAQILDVTGLSDVRDARTFLGGQHLAEVAILDVGGRVAGVDQALV